MGKKGKWEAKKIVLSLLFCQAFQVGHGEAFQIQGTIYNPENKL